MRGSICIYRFYWLYLMQCALLGSVIYRKDAKLNVMNWRKKHAKKSSKTTYCTLRTSFASFILVDFACQY